MMLESNESLFENEVESAKLKFMETYPSISESTLNMFIAQVLNASNIPAYDPSFGRSLFFATTLVTTIGYGQMAPLSTGGKLFCIFYSAVGIPLTLILFTSVTDRLLVRSNACLNSLVEGRSFQLSYLKIKLFYVLFLLSILGVVFIFIPAYILSSLEPTWSYLDGVYFCFISITTIGLGDYIPGDTYKIFVSAYLILSLIFAMFVLKTLYAIPELRIMDLVSLRFTEQQQQHHRNVAEYQILFGKEDTSIRKLYSQNTDHKS